MKKIICIAAGFLLLSISAQNTFAEAIANAEAGDTVTIAVGNVDGASPVVFNPSTNVNIDGVSVATSFAVNGWHEQAELKSSGQRYGMTSASNKMYFQDISSGEAPAGIEGTNTNAFSEANGWYDM